MASRFTPFHFFFSFSPLSQGSPAFLSLYEFYDGLPSDAWQVIATDFSVAVSLVTTRREFPRESQLALGRRKPRGNIRSFLAACLSSLGQPLSWLLMPMPRKSRINYPSGSWIFIQQPSRWELQVPVVVYQVGVTNYT